MKMIEFRDFYSQPGRITDATPYDMLFANLPRDISSLCEIVQGVILHRDWAKGVNLDNERIQETNLRLVRRQLERILVLDDRLLNLKRKPDKRLIGTCRDFSTFLVAVLRSKGIPARARCGFGAYFTPGLYEDHWVVEYWKEQESRWVMVDAQIDRIQRDVLKLDFDTTDMPPGKFIIAGDAWQMYRRGVVNPEKFGIFDMHGSWFIAGNVVRDFLSLNKVELLPWDIWPVMSGWGPEYSFSEEEISWLDKVASLTLVGNNAFAEIRSLYLKGERLNERGGWPEGKFGQ